MLMNRGPTKKKTPLNSDTPVGLVLNKRELRHFKHIAAENPNVEFLYLRENEFVSFDPYAPLNSLKVLDLSINNLLGKMNFMMHTPKLRHLYLTGNQIDTLEGFSSLLHLETLCLSDNAIKSFEFLEGLPNLRVLSLNFNQIETFHHYPFLPELHTLNLRGNPIAEHASYRKMTIAASSSTLVSIDTIEITDDERREVDFYRGKLVFCIVEGMVVEGDQPEEQADAFMLKVQRDAWPNPELALLSISLAPLNSSSNIITEGEPVKLNICLQDTRPHAQRAPNIFHSRHLFPVEFKVTGDAREVFTVGEMNRWTDPIALERREEEADAVFDTTLYLPTGDYEFRYIVDGEEKLSEGQSQSRFGQGPCNIHTVRPSAQNEEEEQTILYIRWLRCNESNGFDEIDGEHNLTYVPTADDIGQCLRAEVIAYVEGNFKFLYFDISSPVMPGLPHCSRLVINGVAAEGSALTVENTYNGGVEGASLLRWFRVTPEGEEIFIERDDPWSPEGYVCSLQDIGCKIKVEYTPVRNDNEAGAATTCIVGPVTPGVPSCRALSISGELREGCMLLAQASYSGGYEGASRFQWFRFSEAQQEYMPIPGETSAAYTCLLEDVKMKLAVEYTPVSQQGVIGETNRCECDDVIQPGPPVILSIRVQGVPAEEAMLTVEHTYSGGYGAMPLIKWFSEKPSGRVRIGRDNHTTCTLTRSEVGFPVSVAVTPVRDDGAKGPVAMASTTDPVAPGRPEIRELRVRPSNDPPKAGTVLNLEYTYCGGEPKGEPDVTWEVSRDDSAWEMVAKTKKVYVVADADVGRMIRVTVVPVRSDGETGESKIRLIEIPHEAAPAAQPSSENGTGASQ